MKWGLAAAMASAAAVAAASGAELLACDCDSSAPAAAPAATVGRCDGLVLSRQHHDDEVHEVRLPRIKDSWSPLSRLARFSASVVSIYFPRKDRGIESGLANCDDPRLFHHRNPRRCRGRTVIVAVAVGTGSRRGSTACASSRRSSRRTAETTNREPGCLSSVGNFPPP